MRTAYSQLDAPMRCSGVRPAGHTEDLLDGMVLGSGRSSEIEAIMWERITEHLPTFDVLGEFAGKDYASAQIKSAFSRLITSFGANGELRGCSQRSS